MLKSFRLEGLDCANCAAKIEDKVNKLEGVNKATVNFMTCKMVLDVAEENTDNVLVEVKKIVKKVEPDVKVTAL